MNTTLLVAIIGAVAVVVAAVLSKPKSSKNEREAILQSLEIYNALPPKSTTRNDLLARIDEDISQFLGGRTVRRNYGSLAYAVVTFLFGALLFTESLNLTTDSGSSFGHNALIIAAKIGIFILVLIFMAFTAILFVDSKRKVLRDRNGREIPRAKPQKK
jgi:hypothetical protein